MALRDREQARKHAQQTGTDSLTSFGAATWAPPYTTPIYGEVDGSPVRILQIGDQPGMSPVYLCVDEHGDSGVVALRDVTITDGAFLPLAEQKRRRTNQ